ncbi:hypothetical protein GQ54DRAFT_310547 [Martensiomyces pterosporus]|nr:hypothetical protein GQ54DRAFT_310547 [Martensiomyces pterosporus]
MDSSAEGTLAPENAAQHTNDSPSLSDHSSFSDSKIESIARQHCFAASTATPVDAAGIHVLLVPVGPVRQGRLARWANAIAQFSRMQISDILPHVDQAAASSYGAGAGASMEVEGAIRFSFSTSAHEEYEYLEGLQTYRQVLGVIGVVDCQLCDDVPAAYDEFLHVLSRHTTAVAYRCLAFDPRPDQLDNIPGVTMIPNAGGSLLFYLQTLLSDFAGTMVSALNLMAKSIEDRADLQTPATEHPPELRQSLASSFEHDAASLVSSAYSESRDDRGEMYETSSVAANEMARRLSHVGSVRRGSATSLPAADVQASADASLSNSGRGRHGGEIDRESIASPVGKKGSAPDDSSVASAAGRFAASGPNAREKKGGSSVNVGRLKKLQGDLYLMSGRLGEAFSAYATSVEASRALNDYLWQAAALEGYCAALLQLCERPNERRLLHAFLSCAPRTTLKENAASFARIGANTAPAGTPAAASTAIRAASSNPANASSGAAASPEDTVDLADMLNQIGALFYQVPLLYEHSYSFAPLLHVESCIREALVLCATRESFLGDPERALAMLLQTNSLHPSPAAQISQETRDVVANVHNLPLRSSINDWLQRGWGSSFSSLALNDQLEVSAEVSSMFRNIGYKRKSSFFLRQFLLLAVPILLRSSTAQRTGRGRSSSSASSTSTHGLSSGRAEHNGSSAFADGSSAFAAVAAAAAAATAATSVAMHPPHSPQQPLAGISGAKRSTFDLHGAGDAVVITREWFTRPKVDLRQAVIACLDALIHSFDTDSKASTGGQERSSGKNVGRESAQNGSQNGWLHLQADIIRECLSVAEALPSYPHAIAAAFRLVSCLNELSAIVPESQRRALADEQHMLKNYIQRTAALFHQRYHFDPAYPGRVSEAHSTSSLLNVMQVVGRDAAVAGDAIRSLLVGIQFCTLPDSPPPIQSVSERQDSQPAQALFLHDPSAQVQGDAPPPLIALQKAHFVATLANPFPFPLDLTDIALIGRVVPGDDGELPAGQLQPEDSGISAAHTRCTIPANESGQVLLEMMPSVSGTLRILGIELCLFQHLSVKCLLAEEGEADAKQRLKEQPLRRRLETERRQLLGLDAAGAANESAMSVRLSAMNPGHSLITCVAPPLPNLHVVESSIGHEESLSLFEGESQIVSFTLVNSSSSAIATNLEISFEPLTPAIKSADDSRADPKLCDLVNAALSYLQPAVPVSIGPQESYRLQVKALGMLGVCGCDIVLRYGGADTDAWVREVRWPLRVSVARLLVPAQDISEGLAAKYLDLPPYIARSLNSTRSVAKSVEDLALVLGDALQAYAEAGDKPADFTLALQDLFYLAEVNIRNDGKTDVDLDIQVDLSPTPGESAEALSAGAKRPNALLKMLTVHVPGHRSLSRVVVPLPRVRLSEQILTAPVPGIDADGGSDESVFYPWSEMLDEDEGAESGGAWVKGGRKPGNGRQFVVSESARLSKQEAAKRREIHWHQQEICGRVRIRWKASQSGRQGYVDPRPLFGLGESSLAIAQHSGLHMHTLVNGKPTTYVDRLFSEARCPAESASTVELLLSNSFSRPLDADISIQAVADGRPAAGALSYPTLQAADSLFYSPRGVQLSMGAEIGTGFAANLPASSSDQRRFRFGPSLAALPSTPESAGQPLPLSGASNITMFSQRSKSALPFAEGFMFDSISRMKLPPIAPGTTHSLELPMYVLRPGRYQLDYEVTERPQPGHAAGGRVLRREALIIDSSGEREP